jgi:hypothetical protein
MAQSITLEGLRNQSITQIFGRRAALAPGNSSASDVEYLVGPRAFRNPTVTITTASTAAEQLPAYGTVLLGTSGASTSATTFHSLQNPIPGVEVLVINTSTLAHQVWLNGGTGTTGVLGYAQPNGAASSGLTTATSVNLPKLGTYFKAKGISTALWFVESNWGTTVTTYGSSAL